MNRKHITAWALYDFANSAYPAVITTAVFNAWYAQVVVGNDEGLGDLWWTRVVSVSVLFVALSSPLLGSVADLAGVRKKMLFLYTVLCVIPVSAFVILEPGMILEGFFLAVIANIGFEGALVFYNAYLPDIAPPGKQGLISGIGYGVGYAGSLAGLLIALPLVSGGMFKLTWISVSLFYAALSVPAFLYLPKDKPGSLSVSSAALKGIVDFRRILKNVLAIKDLRRFLLAFFFYIDGVMTVIVVSGLYAKQTLGFSSQELIYLFIVAQISALIGAFIFAKPTDRYGPKRVISFTLILWTVVVIAAYFIQTKTLFFGVTALAGTGLGAVQAASRSLMSSLIPAGKEAEMFGFYALCGKSSSVLGPFIFGQLSYMLGGNQRISVLAVGLFFVIGLILLQRVKDPAASN